MTLVLAQIPSEPAQALLKLLAGFTLFGCWTTGCLLWRAVLLVAVWGFSIDARQWTLGHFDFLWLECGCYLVEIGRAHD